GRDRQARARRQGPAADPAEVDADRQDLRRRADDHAHPPGREGAAAGVQARRPRPALRRYRPPPRRGPAGPRHPLELTRLASASGAAEDGEQEARLTIPGLKRFATAAALALATAAAAQPDAASAPPEAAAPAPRLYAILLEPGPAWQPGKPFEQQ